MEWIGVADDARIARQRVFGYEARVEARWQSVRIVLVVFDELVEAVYERSVVEHVVGVYRVVDPIVVEVTHAYHGQTEVVRRRATLSYEEEAVKVRIARRRLIASVYGHQNTVETRMLVQIVDTYTISKYLYARYCNSGL